MVRLHHSPPLTNAVGITSNPNKNNLNNSLSLYWTVAQWLERKPDKLEVEGSIPSRPTMKQMLVEDYIAYEAGDEWCNSLSRLQYVEIV